MKASPDDQRLLLDVQEIDTHDRQLDYARTHLVETEAIASLQAKLSESAGDFIARAGVVEDLQKEMERLDADVSVVASRIANDVARAAQTSNAKEAQAIESELISLANRRANLEEMELEVMQRLEDAESALAQITASRDELLSQLSELEESARLRSTQIEEERQGLERSRTELIARIPADLVELYTCQRDRYGIGAALLTRGISGGSGLTLSETDLAKIRSADPNDVVLCPDSNCILVRTNESGL